MSKRKKGELSATMVKEILRSELPAEQLAKLYRTTVEKINEIRSGS